MSIVTTQQFPIQDTPNRLYDLSVIVVSYNTRDVLHRCLQCLDEYSGGLSVEVLVVDNGSRDGSVEMLEMHHPDAVVIRSGANIGFAAANNRALQHASGRYIVLLNSDAFLQPGVLNLAVSHMDREIEVGLGGGRLVGEGYSWQPSARVYPSLLNDFLVLSGLASRFPSSRFFGRTDRTWADPLKAAEVDWVPGAFSIIRREVFSRAGGFDEAFFLYFEEVDLCRRIRSLGYKVWYWPDLVVVHLGGESSKSNRHAVRSRWGSQLLLWSIRSKYLYYRKHHGATACLAHQLELRWYQLRQLRNRFSKSTKRQQNATESATVVGLLKRAWSETDGGKVSPPKPW